jgi:PIN domain nuclease of toxin-antitoxin system
LILLDAYALVAFVREEAAAAEVEGLLRQGESAITAYNFAEALDVLQRVHRLAPERVRSVVEPLLAEDLELVTTGPEEAWRAAEFRLRHYKRRVCEVSLADCLLLAHGGQSSTIATADPGVAKSARAEQLRLIGLPDSAGQRP